MVEERIFRRIEDAGAGRGAGFEDFGRGEVREVACASCKYYLGYVDDGAYCSRMSRTSSRGMRPLTKRYPSSSYRRHISSINSEAGVGRIHPREFCST